jgi:protein-S-isoprenylcysteine O-methyltransferase Ste14
MAWNGMKIVFGEKRDPPQVITKSVFSIVRHPIYFGSIITILGLVILTLSILSFIIWLIIVVFYYYVSRHEEKLLIAKFGKEYEEYMRKVPMLFPFKF